MPTDWWKNTIIYEISFWSFKDSNGDVIGDTISVFGKVFRYTSQIRNEKWRWMGKDINN